MRDATEVSRKQLAYLAGPMRGYAEYNFPAFHAAAAKLRQHGLDVWSPAEHDVNQDGFDPAKDTAQPMKHYMKRDLPAVLDADMVCVLPGWEQSQGARLEVLVAQTCGIPVYEDDTFASIPAPRSETAMRDACHDAAEQEQGCFRAVRAERLLREALAAQSSSAPKEDEEIAWLIELRSYGALKGWLGLWDEVDFGWTLDPNKAIRFCRQKDADAVRNRLEMNGIEEGCEHSSTEHMWIGPKAAVSATAPTTLREKLEEIASTLDKSLGDSDITHIEDDAELIHVAPVQWACSELNKIISAMDRTSEGT